MGLFNKKRPASEVSEAGNHVKSEETTVVPSQNVSDSDLEKTHAVDTSAVAEKESENEAEKETETTGAEAKPGVVSETERQPSSVEVPLEKTLSRGSIAPPPGDDEAVYPSGMTLTLITLALCLSVFLVALDNTIIATAIPKITDHFNSLGDVGWYGSSYLLTTCALQLFFGK